MNLQLTGHQVDITPSIREYVVSKLERINRHFEQVIDVNVILSVQKLDQTVEATVHLSGKDIHVACHDADMYAAIDGLVDKLDRQIIKHKEKFQEGRHGASPKRAAS
ncbi:MAG: ribosome-associated translation inhibitor RaiA [Betaproteobacteria bacterium]|jgi:putative sigma-54 modulation protein|nr:ribosome-associated translation inhibitor RaiA [Betaproteobacteria bacterium]